MKKYWKHIVFGLVLGLILSVCWGYCHLEAYCVFYPSIDTVYADGYSEEDFSRIQVGMSMTEVEQIIGVPLSSWTNKQGITFLWYSQDGKCKLGDFAYLGRGLEVQDNAVSKITSQVMYD